MPFDWASARRKLSLLNFRMQKCSTSDSNRSPSSSPSLSPFPPSSMTYKAAKRPRLTLVRSCIAITCCFVGKECITISPVGVAALVLSTTTTTTTTTASSKHRNKHASRKPTNKIKRTLSYAQQLQKCVTPDEVLEQIAPQISIHTDPDGTLASLILVRLSKQAISLQNYHQSVPHHQSAIRACARTERSSSSSSSSSPLHKEWQHPFLQRVAMVEKVSQSLATAQHIISLKDPTALGGSIEGIKAAAVLSRLIPQLRLVWEPLICAWEDHADRVALELEPHQLSALQWAYDCLNVIAVDGDGIAAEQQYGKKDTIMWDLPLPIQNALSELNLPFRIRPNCVSHLTDLTVSTVVDQVKFKSDDIRSASNKVVKERRQTAWEGDDNVPPFSYSGKDMETAPWSAITESVRNCLYDTGGYYYDGCLLNLYPDGGSGMRYHIDPDQGTLWDHETAVVSIGATRRFSFRPIPLSTRTGSSSSSSRSSRSPAEKLGTSITQGEASQPHTFVLMEGDVTEMFDDCQTRFQHTVKTADDKKEKAPRASFVFKKTLTK